MEVVILSLVLRPPDRLEQRAVSNDFSGVGCQILEDLVLGRSEVDITPGDAYPATLDVQNQVANSGSRSAYYW